MRVLLVGYNENALSGFDGSLPPGSVIVCEEPDLWRDKELAGQAGRHRSFGGVLFGRYQQDDHYLEVLEGIPAFDAVAPGMEYAVEAAARLAETAGLAGAGVRAAAVLRDKLILREVTAAAGMTVPRFREVRDVADLAEFTAHGPCVVKPAGRQASLGVVILERGGDVEETWRMCRTAEEENQLARRPMTWRYMVEERLAGPEYSTECLVRKGEPLFINVTRKRTLPGRHPVETGHVVPGWPVDDPAEPWSRAVADLLAAVGFGTGILHAEWILTSHGPVLVECAGRLPGDRIVDLIDRAYDVNLADLWIRLLAGEVPPAPGEPGLSAAIRFLTPAAGRVDRVVGLDEARAIPGVRRIDVRVGSGDVIVTPRSSWDRPGSALAVAPTTEQAERVAADALSRITVLYRSGDCGGGGR